jgi:FAD/FMN-containing dehydrogenase
LPLDEAVAARDAILKSPLDPAAIDLLNPAARDAEMEKPAWVLAVRAGGNAAAIARYERELAAMGAQAIPVGEEPSAFWRAIQDFTPRYLDAHPDGAVVRVSCTLKELRAVMQPIPGPAIARAGSGVCYAYFEHSGDAPCSPRNRAGVCETVVEFAPENRKEEMDLWPAPGQDLEIMRRIKHMFDPQLLLNRGRLYRRI